jgi:O-antigen/teichoic acid export membrane protein
VVGLAVGLLFLRRYWTPEFKRLPTISPTLRWVAMWRGSWSFGLVAATAAISQLDIAFVSLLAGDQQAGYFGLASRFIMPLSLLGSAAASVALPLAAQEPTRLLHELRRRARWIAAALAGLALLLTFVVPPVLVRLVGARYAPAVPAIRLYCFATVLVTLNQPLASVLQGLRLERWVSRLLVVAVVVHLGGAALGAQVAGASGAATGYAASNVLVSVCCLARLRRASREVRDA